MKPTTALFPALLFAAASVVLVPPTLAQKSYAVGIAGGAAIPTGKFGDTQSTGYAVTGFIALGVPDLPIGVRFDGIYNKFSGRTISPVGGGASVVSPDVRIMGILGNLIYTFPGTTAKPYLIAGGGFYNSKANISGAKAENDFGFSAGFGATFGLGPLAALIEARYHGISRNEAEGGNIQFVPITLGFMF